MCTNAHTDRITLIREHEKKTTEIVTKTTLVCIRTQACWRTCGAYVVVVIACIYVYERVSSNFKLRKLIVVAEHLIYHFTPKKSHAHTKLWSI